jgi:hypothetical protein
VVKVTELWVVKERMSFSKNIHILLVYIYMYITFTNLLLRIIKFVTSTMIYSVH